MVWCDYADGCKYGCRLAWAEMKLILAKVILRFEFEFVPEKNPGEWNDQKVYLINEKTPLWVRLRERV